MTFEIPAHVIFVTEEQQEIEKQARKTKIANILETARQRGVKGSWRVYEIYKTYIKSTYPDYQEYEDAIKELAKILNL